jgi:hypothetical protein
VSDSRRWVITLVSAIFLAAVIGVALGVAFARLKFWPWPVVDSMVEAARSVKQFGEVVPSGRRTKAPEDAARARFVVHDPARMQGGYYAIAGWDDGRDFYAAWLYDGEGRLRHTWPIVYHRIDAKSPTGSDDSPHGFAVLPDGSVIANFDGGRAMARFDACGEPVWRKEGVFHHLISQAEDGSFWSWRGDDNTAYGHFQYLVNFDGETGDSLREIGLVEDVLRRDPAASIVLGVGDDRELRKFEGDPDRREVDDLFHPNDIEELDTRLAPRFPMFSAGDLLISIRRTNLVAVLDGEDYRLKWWSHGPWISQHDADFTGDGLISVYNNNTGRGRSEIVRIDPATREVTQLPSAANAGWHSPYMGLHQYLPNGNVLIVSPGEGRVIERSPAGELVMEFNNMPEEGSPFNDHVENGVWLPGDFFETLPACGSESP